jgi:hypothetical protein
VVCALRDNVKEIDVNLPIASPDAWFAVDTPVVHS